MNGDRLARSWTSLYTRGVSPTAREERVAELESDLWEHRAATGDGLATQAAILSRCVRGMPADLAWRRRQARRPFTLRQVARGAGWTVFGVAAAFLLAVTGSGAAPLVGLAEHQDWDPADVAGWERASAALFLILLGGLVLLWRAPRLGVVVASSGACALTLYCPWAIVLFGPSAVAVTAGAVTIARRCAARGEAAL